MSLNIPVYTYHRIDDITNALCGKRSFDYPLSDEAGWAEDFRNYFWDFARDEDAGNESLVYFGPDYLYEVLEDGWKYEVFSYNKVALEIDDYVYLNEIAEFFATHFPDGSGYWEVSILFSW